MKNEIIVNCRRLSLFFAPILYIFLCYVHHIGCEYNENYIHSTIIPDDHDHESSSKSSHGYDEENENENNTNFVFRSNNNYLNPTFNSNIGLCINDNFMSIVNNENNNQVNCNDRNLDFKFKRESNNVEYFDENENLNFATPLINNARDDDGLKICKNTLNGLLITAGKF
jgi:hypothetical protein